MPLIKVNCAACGAPISIPPETDLEFITCSSCGTALQVEHGEGYISLKIAEKIAQSIEESGHATRKVIEENSQLQRHELQRIQLAQELTAAELRLTNIQAEIRMLNRAAGTPTIYAQLVNLYRNEYQVMEHIRSLKTQMTDLACDPIPARLEALKWELGWIPLEVAALTHGNHPQRMQMAAVLTRRRQELERQYQGLKLQAFRDMFPSFRVENPPLDDQEKLAECLKQVKADEQKLRQYLGSAEGAALHREITERQTMLWAAWQKLEGQRLNGMLVSPGYRVDARSLPSLGEYYRKLQQDLQTLAGLPGNAVAREFQVRLKREAENTARLIHALQRK